MDEHRTEFENFLHEFRPLHPRPLPEPTLASRARRVGARVLLLATITGSFWLATRRPGLGDKMDAGNNLPLTGRALLQLALEDPYALDAALTAASKQMLPRFDGSDSTLRALAKQ